MPESVEQEIVAETTMTTPEKLFLIMQLAFGATSERMEKLTQMYTDYGEVFATAPASSKEHFHLAVPGGFCTHTMNVYNNALELTTLFRKQGGVSDYTRAELTMAAIHHDLGKLGMPGIPHYLPETSQWHRDNQGSRYKTNPQLPFMKVPLRSLFVLQKYGVELTENEYMSIFLHDGMFAEENKAYYNSYDKFAIRSNLPYIIHLSDWLSSIGEKDGVKQKYLTELNND